MQSEQIRQNEWRAALGKDWSHRNLVFTTPDGSPLQPRNVYRRCTQLVERSALSRISTQGMRHSAASALWAQTRDLLLVSQLLGHAQPSTTANIHAHLFKDAPIGAVETMENALSSQ